MDFSHLKRHYNIEVRQSLKALVGEIEATLGEILICDIQESERFKWKHKLGWTEEEFPACTQFINGHHTVFLSKLFAGEQHLAHEVLHIDLVHRGFKRYVVDIPRDFAGNEALGPKLGQVFEETLNLMEHSLMYPEFLQMGFSVASQDPVANPLRLSMTVGSWIRKKVP